MSKDKPAKKKVVVTPTQKKQGQAPKTRSRSTRPATPEVELLFGREHYILMGAGAVLVALGLLLMSGGSMPSSDVWDDGLIYSFRRTVLAPIVILTGLVIEIVAIFKK